MKISALPTQASAQIRTANGAPQGPENTNQDNTNEPKDDVVTLGQDYASFKRDAAIGLLALATRTVPDAINTFTGNQPLSWLPAVSGVVVGAPILASGLVEARNADGLHGRVNGIIHAGVGTALMVAPHLGGNIASYVTGVSLGLLAAKAVVDNRGEAASIVAKESWGIAKDATLGWFQGPGGAPEEPPAPPAPPADPKQP